MFLFYVDMTLNKEALCSLQNVHISKTKQNVGKKFGLLRICAKQCLVALHREDRKIRVCINFNNC